VTVHLFSPGSLILLTNETVHQDITVHRDITEILLKELFQFTTISSVFQMFYFRPCFCLKEKDSQTCIKRSPLGGKKVFLIHATFIKRSPLGKKRSSKTGDLFKEVPFI
jgi:hypothetical protein